MTIQFDTTNRIILDGEYAGLAVIQRRDGTVICTPEGITTKYAEHKMPHARYSTAHDKPASGAAGRAQLEIDVRELLEKLV